jgi:hypothetical protein
LSSGLIRLKSHVAGSDAKYGGWGAYCLMVALLVAMQAVSLVIIWPWAYLAGAKAKAQARQLFMAVNRLPISCKRVEWLDKKEGDLANSDTEYPDMPKPAAFACNNEWTLFFAGL